MRSFKTLLGSVLGLIALVAAGCAVPPSGGGGAVTIASVGDYGYDHPYIQELGKLVDRIDPNYVLTTGDNVQTPLSVSGTNRYDLVVGRHFW